MTSGKVIWKTIMLDPNEVCLKKVLRCGQAFRWKCIDGIYSCSIKKRILLLKQNDNILQYGSIPYMKDTISIITEYFNLGVNVNQLYKKWCIRDHRFSKCSSSFQGVRILKQDPWETLISFICSSNNNVKRISKMCESLTIHYGTYLGEFQGINHYTFPLPADLAGDDIEQQLRDLGFGYRARFINQTAKMMIESPDTYKKLKSKKLTTLTRSKCQDFLLKFPGVGPKVADCVALMALNKREVVPIDTHVYQIAKRDYHFHSKTKNKTMTKNVYDEIQQFFIDLWGDYAGWAHSLLFAADLRDLDNGINKTTKREHSGDNSEAIKVKRNHF